MAEPSAADSFVVAAVKNVKGIWLTYSMCMDL